MRQQIDDGRINRVVELMTVELGLLFRQLNTIHGIAGIIRPMIVAGVKQQQDGRI